MRARTRDAPLVLLSNVVTLGKVDEVDNGLGGKELELVDDVDLKVEGWWGGRERKVSFERSSRREEENEGGLTSRLVQVPFRTSLSSSPTNL